MAVRYREDRGVWVTAIEGPLGRESKHFATEQEATQYEMLQNKACLLKLHSISMQLDWGNKGDTQKRRAGFAVTRLGSHLHPKQVTRQKLDGYVATRLGEGKSSSTIRAELSGLKVMLTRAVRLGWLDVLPLFPEGRTLPLPESRQLVLPDEWYEELLLQLEWSEHRLERSVVIFCRRLGCRVDEALSLRWERVDLKERRVQFVKTKGVNARTLPLNDETLALLTALKKRKNEMVFPISYNNFRDHYKGRKRKGEWEYKGGIYRVCEKLGLGSNILEEWVTHTLRHTRITELANKGASAPQIQAWAGHKSLLTSQKYIHSSGVSLTHLADC